MMFINSIFLPKAISDQTMPEGISGKIGNFSHLFSNVFHIVMDEQEGTVPLQLTKLSPESTSDSQNELLKVSLLSDSKLTLETKNISVIVSAFLSKINPGEFAEELADTNKVKVNEKTPQFFSLSKNEFVKEIKNIIDALKNGDIKNLENVEIILIANGQSIKINPLTTNSAELENWVTCQLKTNSDFEIIVKSGQQKLAVDVESIKNETTKPYMPVEIISVSTGEDVEQKTVSISNNKPVDLATSLKNNIELQTQFQQPLEGLQSTVVTTNEQSLKTQKLTLQKQFNTPLNGEVNLNTKVETELVADVTSNVKVDPNGKSIIDQTFVNKNSAQNISTVSTDLKKEFISGLKSELNSKTEISTSKGNVLSDSNSSILKNVNAVKTTNTDIKSLNADKKLKTNVLQSDEINTNSETINQSSEINVKELSKTDNKISLKANHKINLVPLNKNDVKEKAVLNELIEKTNVKEINVNVQRFAKTANTNAPKIKDTYQPELNSLKENTTKIQSNELNNKIIGASKVQSNNKLSGQQELFVKKGSIENQQTVSPKNESFRSTNNNHQTLKESVVTKSGEKINAEKNNLEQIKNPLIDSNKAKPEAIVNPLTKKIVLPEIKSEQRAVENKTNSLIVKNENLKLKTTDYVETVNKEDVKESVVESTKKSLTPQNKTEHKPFEYKSTSKIVDDNSDEMLNSKTVKEVAKENIKEIAALKTNPSLKNKSSEKTEVNLTHNPEKITSNLKEKSIVENLRTSLKEFANDETKQEPVNKNQVETKTVKVDFMQRRVYSQIPLLEVFADEAKVQNAKSPVLNIETNKNEKTKYTNEPIKTDINTTEQKPKSDKQVWVKVSLEKNDYEVVSEVRKSSHQQSKITIDANTDGMKKDSEQNNFSEKESREFSKSKPQTVSVETSQNTEAKNVNQNQTTSAQQDLTAGLKQEIKTESNPFKSTLHTEETKFSSRAAEMVEKVKVISSGEMLREISKVFESGEKQSIVLRLVPKELGSIKIMLDTIDNVLTAKVEVENETVGHIVRNNVDQLKQNLLQSGVHINSINISYHNSDQKQNGFSNQKRKNPAYQQNIDAEENDESIVSKKMGYNTYEYLA